MTVGRGLRLSEISLLLRQEAAERCEGGGEAIAERHTAQGDESRPYPHAGVSPPTSVKSLASTARWGVPQSKSQGWWTTNGRTKPAGVPNEKQSHGAVGGVHRKESVSRDRDGRSRDDDVVKRRGECGGG